MRKEFCPMKKFSVLTMMLALTVTSAYAANFGDSLKNAVKNDVKSVKQAVKQDLKNQRTEAQNQRAKQTAEKRNAVIKERDQKINAINEEIKAKEKEIKDVEQNKSMTQTEKTLKLKAYNRQLEGLKSKKENTNKLYNARINAAQ